MLKPLFIETLVLLLNNRSITTMLTKDHITEVALTLFSKNGYEKTSIREIAKTADISLGLLYNYFESKEALLADILANGMGNIKLSFTFPKNAEEPLRTLMENVFRVLQEKKQHWRLMHSIRMQDAAMENFKAEQEASKSYMLTELSLVLESMGYRQPMQEAILLFATIDGLAGQFLLNEKYPMYKMLALLVEKYRAPQ